MSTNGKTCIIYDGYYNGKKNVAEHFHDGTELIYIRSGSCITDSCGCGTLKCRAGGVCVIPPGVRHSQKNNSPDCYTQYVVFTGKPFPEKFTWIDTENDSLIRHWFDDILALSGENAVSQAEILLDLLCERIERMMAFRIDAAKYPASLLKAVEFIEKHYAEQIYVPEIIEKSGVSRTYLMKFFLKFLHRSIGTYLMEVRMNHARQLLCMNRYYNVSEIAAMTGYSDPDYFCRKFKTIYGITPLEYRNFPSRYTREIENRHHRFLPLYLQE